MPHFKCLACRVRVWHDGNPADHSDDPCPGCAGPLEVVKRAEEILGFRALTARPLPDRTIADQVRETIAGNDAARIRRLRAERGHDPRP